MRQRPDNARPARRTSAWPWIVLGLWAVLVFGVHLLVNLFNAVKIAGFPLGFYMAAQGVPVALAVLLFLHARRDLGEDQGNTIGENE